MVGERHSEIGGPESDSSVQGGGEGSRRHGRGWGGTFGGRDPARGYNRSGLLPLQRETTDRPIIVANRLGEITVEEWKVEGRRSSEETVNNRRGTELASSTNRAPSFRFFFLHCCPRFSAAYVG